MKNISRKTCIYHQTFSKTLQEMRAFSKFQKHPTKGLKMRNLIKKFFFKNQLKISRLIIFYDITILILLNNFYSNSLPNNHPPTKPIAHDEKIIFAHT